MRFFRYLLRFKTVIMAKPSSSKLPHEEFHTKFDFYHFFPFLSK